MPAIQFRIYYPFMTMDFVDALHIFGKKIAR